MSKLTVILAALAAGLAAECAYLLNQVDAERERTRAEADRRMELEARVQQMEREQLAAAAAKVADARASATAAQDASSTQAATFPSDASSDDDTESAPSPLVDSQRIRVRSMLHDTASRELLRARAIASMRAQYPELANDLALTNDEYERLLALLGEHHLQQLDHVEGGDPASAPRFEGIEELMDVQKLELAGLLGAEKAQEFDDYMASQGVRDQVRRLRARMGAGNTLSDDQNTRLVAALWEEGKRFSAELDEQYAGESITYTLGGWYGSHFMASDSMSTSIEEQILTQMEEYNGRISRAAASVLTQQQLEVFTRLQDEDLAMQRVRLRMEMNLAAD